MVPRCVSMLLGQDLLTMQRNSLVASRRRTPETRQHIPGQLKVALPHAKVPRAISSSLLVRVYSMKGWNEQAMQEFKQALEINPRHENTLFNIALLYEKMGDTDKAIMYYNKTIDSNLGNAKAQYHLGKNYFEKKQYDEAIHAFEISLMANPENIEAYQDIGEAYEAKGMKEKAESYFSLYQKQLKSGR